MPSSRSMKTIPCSSIVACLSLFAGCVTNDFKVVEALEIGLEMSEVETVVAAYGFNKEQSLTRPDDGWPETDDSYTNLAGRAEVVEDSKGIEIHQADYYPVGHGFLGYGWLFTFFDQDGKLVHYYRKQIN